MVSNNSFEPVNDSVGHSFNRSPSLRKNKMIGQTKPNQMDPSKLGMYDENKVAGVETNYGINPEVQNQSQNQY